jgi:hypothetical protein
VAVEPFANDDTADNLNPIGRLFYSVSTLICTPASLSRETGTALGAQAGETRLRDVVTAGGFTRFRRAAETPFNLVLEARPREDTDGAGSNTGSIRPPLVGPPQRS